jgi:hypothetical protein
MHLYQHHEICDLVTKSVISNNILHGSIKFIISEIEEDQNIAPEWRFCNII